MTKDKSPGGCMRSEVDAGGHGLTLGPQCAGTQGSPVVLV